MSIESFEEKFLTGADKCPECGAELTAFKKFIAGTEFMWCGWCPSCQKNRVTIHGNNPKEPAHDGE